MRATPDGVLKKLDRMLVLLATKEQWTKGVMHEVGFYGNNGKKPVHKYCLWGAARRAGNGDQLLRELAYTIGVKGGDYGLSVITNYNDSWGRKFAEIKSVIRMTRNRVAKKGLNAWVKK